MGYSCHLGSAVRIKLLDADGQPIHAGRMPAAGSMGDYQSRCGEDEPLQQLRVKDRLVIAYRHAVISSGWNRWSARRCGLPNAAVELPAVAAALAAGLLAEHMGFADLMGMAPIAFA